MKLKRHVKRLKVKLRSHSEAREAARVKRLHEEGNKARREAAKLRKESAAREQANEAKESLRQARTRAKAAKGKSKSEAALKALGKEMAKAAKAFYKYANKPSKKRK